MDLSVAGCRVTALKAGSIIADLVLAVTQPALHMARPDLKLNSQNLQRLFNVSAAQSLARNYTLSLERVNVTGGSLLCITTIDCVLLASVEISMACPSVFCCLLPISARA